MHPPDAIYHRTGGKLGQVVSESVEDAGEAKDYLILTNIDYEQGLPAGQRDYADATAAIPTGSAAAEDDDLARITLRKIGPYLNTGTLSIELSNPSAVRLFKSDGAVLSSLSLDLSNPTGYLADLRNGDVDAYGLIDFVFAIQGPPL